MGRAPCCDKANVKRGPWSPEEDAALRSYVEKHGTGGNWIALPQKAGLKRCGKSCRLRWLNYLRPDIKHGGFTEEEDNIIYTLFKNIGSRWSVIASHLPGRTDNDVKNYWNTKLKKRLMAAGQITSLSTPPTPPTPALPPIPTIKPEFANFSAAPFDASFNGLTTQDPYRVFQEFQYSFPPSGFVEQPEFAHGFAENWSANGSVADDSDAFFLSELEFGQQGLYQSTVTYS